MRFHFKNGIFIIARLASVGCVVYLYYNVI